MNTFAEKKKEFLINMREKYRSDDIEAMFLSGSATDEETELRALLEKKFDELFGPLG